MRENPAANIDLPDFPEHQLASPDLRDQLQKTLGDAYTLERELGGGGMARVFVAEEAALGRKVVVKVLPPDLAAEVSSERFRREVRVAAGLQHPHIVSVLSAGGSTGVLYYTMPFVEGESLRARLERERQLPVSEAVQLAREVAEALAYAHGRGIVHRDVKPENVLLSGGHAMLTDFGIAKAVADARGGTLTATGLSLGTPQYMAPEQASGERDADGRADVYALGCILYEMLAGEPPFRGPSMQAVVAKHMAAPFPQVRHGRPDVPEWIDAVIRQATAKAPADRYPTAAALAEALAVPLAAIAGGGAGTARNARGRLGRPRALRVIAAIVVVGALLGYAALRRRAPSPGGLPSIAVLPFVNLSGDTTYDYFAEGMSDQLRSDLTSLPGLRVMGHASSSQFRGRTVDRHDAGRKLGVAELVEGSVNRSGERLRVTAELVNVADGTALSSMTFDTRVTDLATIQDSLTRAIVGKLRISLASARVDTAGHGGLRGTANFGAYDLLMRATFASDRHDFARAIDFLNAAVTIDPAFARAHAVLAFLYARRPLSGVGSRDSALVLARRSLAKAIALDSTLLEVYVAKSMIESLEWNFVEADDAQARALILYPGSAEVHSTRAATLGHLGRAMEAVAEERRAKELDPLSVQTLLSLQYALYVVREYQASIRETSGILDLDAGANAVRFWYQAAGTAYLFAGKLDSATAAFEKAVHIDPTLGGGRIYHLLFGYAAAGRWKEAREQRALLEHERGGNSENFQRIFIHEAFGRMDSAMVDLERAVAAKEPLYLTVDFSCDPRFDPLKADPKFGVLMKRIGVTVCPASGRWPLATPPE
ncbi:MAG TPA: protein kinase [Gemmatimonadaceae bacterium]|nr:protein kinase [Gemmatimonadaceae bacterium]